MVVPKSSPTCLECGTKIIRTGQRQAFCTPKCRSLNYYRRKPRIFHDQCPDCGGTKSIKNARCRACNGLRFRGKRGPRAMARTCPYCEAAIRLVTWRGREIARCGGCGLETTTGELKRIAFETRLVEIAA